MPRIIVPPHVAHGIAEGRITQHRRPVDTRRPRYVRRTTVGGSSQHLSQPWTPKPGRRLQVIRSNDPRLARDSSERPVARCHVEIVRAWRHPHGRITPPEIAAQGHGSLADYARGWIAVHDHDWLWTVTEPVRKPDDTLTTAASRLTDDEALDRFGARWADRHVWALELLLVTAPDTFLARAHEHGSDTLGRTATASNAFDIGTDIYGNERALEVVDPEDLNPTWANAANRRWREARAGQDRAPVQHLRRPPA